MWSSGLERLARPLYVSYGLHAEERVIEDYVGIWCSWLAFLTIPVVRTLTFHTRQAARNDSQHTNFDVSCEKNGWPGECEDRMACEGAVAHGPTLDVWMRNRGADDHASPTEAIVQTASSRPPHI